MVYFSSDNSWKHSQAMKKYRQQMIKQTNSFIDWSLANSHELPQIPRRRVDKGGFGKIFDTPDGQKLINQWWNQVFDANLPF